MIPSRFNLRRMSLSIGGVPVHTSTVSGSFTISPRYVDHPQKLHSVLAFELWNQFTRQPPTQCTLDDLHPLTHGKMVIVTRSTMYTTDYGSAGFTKHAAVRDDRGRVVAESRLTTRGVFATYLAETMVNQQRRKLLAAQMTQGDQ